MLRIATRIAAVKPIAPSARFAARCFSEKLSIPSDREQQGGRRREEIDAEDKGEVGFNRDPIIPSADAGTKENPILVPSGFHRRTVGYEDPFTHALVWFNLDKGALHYVPDVNLYFKLDYNGGH
jgi:hypothetical protein